MNDNRISQFFEGLLEPIVLLNPRKLFPYEQLCIASVDLRPNEIGSNKALSNER